MKKALLYAGVLLFVVSCASPAIRKETLDRGLRNIPPSELVNNGPRYTGKLLVLGGIIAETRLTGDGTMVEAAYVPVDKKGYPLETAGASTGRFLAFSPKEQGLLDPLMYRQGKMITVAGVYTGTRAGTIGQMPYVFPVITIQELHLFTQEELRPSYPNTFFSFGFLFGGHH